MTLPVPLIAGEFDGAIFGDRVLVLDDDTLDHHFAALGGRIGAMPAHAGSRFTQRIAQRFGAKLAARYAARLGMRAEGLAGAWYFSIWSELCTLIPLRHLARRLARRAAGAIVVIPLEPGPRSYLTFWDRSGLEPFYLAAELHRQGVAVAFVSRAPEAIRASRRQGSITVRLLPHSAWQRPFLPQQEPRSGASAVVAAGMRGVDRVLARIADPVVVACAFSVPGRSDFALTDSHNGLPAIELTLQCKPVSALAAYPAPAGAVDSISPDLGGWLFDVLGPPTAWAATEAARLARTRGLTEAHVCDHMFWESAIVADAVRGAGGCVVLWPHSSNAVHVAAQLPGGPSRINCATRSASRAWQARFPEIPCNIVSDTILKPCDVPRPVTPSRPITVVVIAGSHSLNRMPVIDYEGHRRSYRRLFRGLAAAGPGVRFVCKAKPPWESIEWLQSLVGSDPTLDEIREAPTEIDLPNLIYVSVSFGSTALLEGLGRGIPCMVVREIPVEDYTAIRPDLFPVGPVEMILARLRECQDHSALRSMAERQLAWYAQETHFGPDALRSHEKSPPAGSAEAVEVAGAPPRRSTVILP